MICLIVFALLGLFELLNGLLFSCLILGNSYSFILYFYIMFIMFIGVFIWFFGDFGLFYNSWSGNLEFSLWEIGMQ